VRPFFLFNLKFLKQFLSIFVSKTNLLKIKCFGGQCVVRKRKNKSGGSPPVGGIGITTHPSNEKCKKKKTKKNNSNFSEKITIPATVLLHPASGGNVSIFFKKSPIFFASRHLVKCPKVQ